MYAYPRRPWYLTSCSLHSQRPSWSYAPVIVLSPKSRDFACHSQWLSRSRLMRGGGENVILPRRCAVCTPSAALATHIV